MTISKCLAGVGMLAGFMACGALSPCLASDAETAPSLISAMPKASGTSTTQIAETHARAGPNDKPSVTRESRCSDMLAPIGIVVALLGVLATIILTCWQLAAAQSESVYCHRESAGKARQ